MGTCPKIVILEGENRDLLLWAIVGPPLFTNMAANPMLEAPEPGPAGPRLVRPMVRLTSLGALRSGRRRGGGAVAAILKKNVIFRPFWGVWSIFHDLETFSLKNSEFPGPSRGRPVAR